MPGGSLNSAMEVSASVECSVGVDRGDVPVNRGLVEERTGERVPGELEEVGAREIHRLGGANEIVGDIAAEIGGVVGVAGDAQAEIEHALHRMLLQVHHHAELQVGERADGKRHAFADEALYEGRIFECAVAMVDAVDMED